MESTQFVEYFTNQLENEEGAVITEATPFREIAEWDSLVALSIIAMVDEKYKVKLTGDDIRNATTVGDLFQVVKTKVG